MSTKLFLMHVVATAVVALLLTARIPNVIAGEGEPGARIEGTLAYEGGVPQRRELILIPAGEPQPVDLARFCCEDREVSEDGTPADSAAQRTGTGTGTGDVYADTTGSFAFSDLAAGDYLLLLVEVIADPTYVNPPPLEVAVLDVSGIRSLPAYPLSVTDGRTTAIEVVYADAEALPLARVKLVLTSISEEDFREDGYAEPYPVSGMAVDFDPPASEARVTPQDDGVLIEELADGTYDLVVHTSDDKRIHVPDLTVQRGDDITLEYGIFPPQTGGLSLPETGIQDSSSSMPWSLLALVIAGAAIAGFSGAAWKYRLNRH